MIGAGVLATWFGEFDRADKDFNDWYRRRHLPERLSVPGFLRGRRYAAVGGGPPYFTFYETVNAAVLASRALLERLNDPRDWTRRVLPRMIRCSISSRPLARMQIWLSFLWTSMPIWSMVGLSSLRR